jgi:phosphoribosylformimino-5-aminoimidazole carboxamide ribotide isomerase
MILYPAIDLIDGVCVRLSKGDFDQKTVYENGPVEVAQNYKKQGAVWLHLVDLDGAKDPEKRQLMLIENIVKQSELKVQTGGGIRIADDVAQLIDIGVSRVVIGSLAVKNPEIVQELFQQYGAERICLAADVKSKGQDYYIAVSGWQEESDLLLSNFIEGFLPFGLKHVLCTDISKDGMMAGCNIALYESLVTQYPALCFQASGGIHTLDDLSQLPTDGAVIGKALYEGAFTLKKALEVATC